VRLFVSIDLPEEVQQKLDSWLPSLRGLRKTDPGQIHLTLFFLGEVSSNEAGTVPGLLQEIRFEPFDMQIRGIGTFPDENKPKVIWAGVEEIESLMNLQKDVEHAVKQFNPEAAGRPYIPHITLARVKGRFNPKHYPGIFETKESVSFHVNHFSLKKSILKPERSVHEVLRTFK
jgi:RNA 2',3'-cyclic 3'-phosphodiesterase